MSPSRKGSLLQEQRSPDSEASWNRTDPLRLLPQARSSLKTRHGASLTKEEGRIPRCWHSTRGWGTPMPLEGTSGNRNLPSLCFTSWEAGPPPAAPTDPPQSLLPQPNLITSLIPLCEQGTTSTSEAVALKGRPAHLAYLPHLAVASLHLLRVKTGFQRASQSSGKANSFLPPLPTCSQGNSEAQDSSDVITVQASNKLGFL